MKSKGKEKVVIKSEETAENWCFVCKDGGDLRICDYKQCLKSYHPCCVGKGNSFLTSESYWACAWHTCFICRKYPYVHCYTCNNAVCRRCFPDSDFLQVKGKSGFCESCLKLVLLIEENKDYDSDGERVDFTDRETYEGLFMEYYMIIKKEEGFELGDIYVAQDSVKMKKNYQSGSGSEEFEEEEDQLSDSDSAESEKKCSRMRKKKRSERHNSAKQILMKSNKKEFIGGISRSLMEFLSSIGKSPSEKLLQHDATSIVNEYVKENKLFNPEKRRMIICDARLYTLFRRRTISKYKVYDLLEGEFAENRDESEDELEYDSEDNNAGIRHASEKKRKLHMEKKSQEKELVRNVPQSRFASITIENVKLVYLKRSLLNELLNQPESFEEKVIGCFVRVKSDPYDYRSRNSHQLMEVKGVKTVPAGENETETTLLVSIVPKEIRISLVSDDDFSEEECEDLRQKMLAGQLERPTVEELQQKAKVLHKDITLHRINKELALLQHLIDRANEKGWRRDLFEYLEKKKKLQTPSEQLRLLENVPTVIPDIPDLDSNPGDGINDMKSDQCNSSVLGNGQTHRTSEEMAQHGNTSPPDRKQLFSEKFQHCHTPAPNGEPLQNEVEVKESLDGGYKQTTRKGSITDVGKIKTGYFIANQKVDNPENQTWCVQGPGGFQDKCCLSLLKRFSDISPNASKFKVWREDQNQDNAIWLPDAIRTAFPKK